MYPKNITISNTITPPETWRPPTYSYQLEIILYNFLEQYHYADIPYHTPLWNPLEGEPLKCISCGNPPLLWSPYQVYAHCKHHPPYYVKELAEFYNDWKNIKYLLFLNFLQKTPKFPKDT
jgi:hypothetical protein